MPPIALAGSYLIITILIVDTVYRGSLALRGRLVVSESAPDAGSISYMLGLLPPLSGLLAATVFSMLVPALAMGAYLWSDYGVGAVSLGVLLALACSIGTVAPTLALGYVKLHPAPSSQMPARTGMLVLVAADLLLSAAFEEVVFRGQLLSCLSASLNPASAIAVSAGVFGLVHIWKRRDAPLTWALNTALFGILAGQLVLLTGTIASSIALHFVWNLMQTPILGLPANGTEYDHGLCVATVNGPELLTGGDWSLDAGLAATAALVAGIGFVCLAF